MTRDTWRDREGFGRDKEVSPGVWSAVGPDEQDHSIHCAFITLRGILPCECDATRRRFSEWHHQWLRWATVRTYTSRTSPLVKWPVQGPDGDWWVPGVDFNDD